MNLIPTITKPLFWIPASLSLATLIVSGATSQPTQSQVLGVKQEQSSIVAISSKSSYSLVSSSIQILSSSSQISSQISSASSSIISSNESLIQASVKQYVPPQPVYTKPKVEIPAVVNSVQPKTIIPVTPIAVKPTIQEQKPVIATTPNNEINYNTQNPIQAICRDGSQSHSSGRGTCSHHGGVDHYL